MSLYHTFDVDVHFHGQRGGRGGFCDRGDRGGGADSGSRGGWRGHGGFGKRGARGGFGGHGDRGGGADLATRGGQNRRGRGGFGTWTPKGSGPQVKPVSASPPPPFGDLIETIDREDIEKPPPDRPCGITTARLIASYNWMDSPSPKIMIPGKPALWTPRKGSYQLREDDGIYYRDPNAAAYGDHPMEAAVVSVMKMNSPSSHGHIDLFACGSTLGNLLRFVRGVDHSFRMLVEVVGNTVHLIRRENSPKERIIGVRGFGHVFPEENTTWEKDVTGSNSHQRIMRYRFDGLDMMVRFQGDGYVKLIDEEEHHHAPTAVGASPQPESLLLNALQALKIREEVRPTLEEALQTVTGGQIVPQDAMFDIKTRSINVKHRDTLGEELPRLWLAQVKRFILAHHTSGKFEDVEIQDVSENIEAWEADNQAALRRFAQLLRRIIESRLREGPEVKVEIVRREGSDSLEILKRLPDAGAPFSDETRRKWSDWLHGYSDGGADSDEESPEREGDNDLGEFTDDDSENFTACDETCGYCGRCATSLI